MRSSRAVDSLGQSGPRVSRYPPWPCHPHKVGSPQRGWSANQFLDRHRTEVAGFEPARRFPGEATPCGVPVRMIVPGNKVVLPLRNSINRGTSKIMSFVFQSCSTSPFDVKLDRQCVGVGDIVGGDQAWPHRREGVEVLPRHHWLPPHLLCQSRALTSLAQCSRARAPSRVRAAHSCTACRITTANSHS